VRRRIERMNHGDASERAHSYQKQLLQEELESSFALVKQYEDYIKQFTAVHTKCSNKINWTYIQSELEPVKPEYASKLEDQARLNRQRYQPGFIDRLLKNDLKNIRKLEDSILSAIDLDKNNHTQRINDYTEDLTEWKILQKFATGVFRKDPDTFKDVSLYFRLFDEIKELGTDISIRFQEELVMADLKVHPQSSLPKHTLSLSANGKLSRKDMTATRYNELYQDYVCGCVIRIAREIFALLPVETVIINAKANLLNSRSEHLQEQTILSAKMPLKTINMLNFNTFDPSNALSNFVHNMKFTKTTGFSPVDSLRESMGGLDNKIMLGDLSEYKRALELPETLSVENNGFEPITSSLPNKVVKWLMTRFDLFILHDFASSWQFLVAIP
jgi:hypothetical protein